MFNLLPQPLKLLLDSFLQKIGLNKQQAGIIVALIFLFSYGGFYLGSLNDNSKNALGINTDSSNKQLTVIDQNKIPRSIPVDESTIIQFDQSDWNLRGFYKNKEGYYCPSDSKQNYYFAWHKYENPLLSTFFIKFQVMPSSEITEGKSSEAVIKIGQKDKVEYLEFYLPVRIKETVHYKQRDILKENLVFQTGKELSYPIKIDEPIELTTNIEAVEKNHIQTDFRVTYLSVNKGIVLSDPFSYQTFIVDETNPKDLMTRFGFGIDNKSCFKIIKYCFSQTCKLNN